MSILITGGYGFIGRNLIKQLENEKIIILDNLNKQVHGEWREDGTFPSYAKTNDNIKFYCGDIINEKLVNEIFEKNEITSIVHLASSVGVGQSMYDVKNYSMVNDYGTANLWQTIIDKKPKSLKKFIVASSMSIYGEGAKLLNGQHVNTTEHKKLEPTSVYALQKLNQEKISLILGESLGIKTYGLRLFNTYGPLQSLNNPYTGILAIFGSAMINNQNCIIYEDGLQRRDFIHVHDVCRAFKYTLEGGIKNSGVYNVGTGIGTTVIDIFKKMRSYLNKPNIKSIITGTRRKGDVRHCYASVMEMTYAGFKTTINIDYGLKEYCNWLKTQNSNNLQPTAHSELIENNILE